MRWLALLLLSGGVAFAGGDKPVRKPAPPDLPQERLSNFVDAVIADKQGDLDRAIARYRSVTGGNDVPAIVYNIADLQRRSEQLEGAIRSYRRYLELAPQAPDRAAVTQLIERLEQTPASVVVDGEDLDAVVFVDGKRVGISPVVTSLTNGWHVIDRIGPTSYDHDYVNARPLLHEQVTASGVRKGNVVLSTSTTYGGSWTDKGVTYRMNDRFELPAGTYETYFFKPALGCSPLRFTVPATGLVYVFIDAPRELPRGTCVKLKVTTHQLRGGA